MIRFFRNARHRLLKDSKVSRYLLYALGEIILVVLGILIALKIDNWNSHNQLNTKAKAILKEIRQDLMANIAQSEIVMERYLLVDSLGQLVVSNKLTKEDYEEKSVLNRGLYLSLWYDDLPISNNNYLKFAALYDGLDKNYKPIQKILDELYLGYRPYIETYNQRLHSTVFDNIDYIAKNKDWYYIWRTNSRAMTDDMANYFTSESIYKNQYLRYQNDCYNLVEISEGFRLHAMKACKMLNRFLGETEEKTELLDPKIKIALMDKYIGDYSLKSDYPLLKTITRFSIYNEDEHLFMDIGDGESIELSKLNDHVFYNHEKLLIFNFNLNGNPTTVDISYSRVLSHYQFSK